MDAPIDASRERSLLFTPSQVIAIGLVVVSIGWAMWLLRDQSAPEETELLAGTVLPSSELAIIEAAFDRAKLTDYRTDSGRVYVPRSRQSAFMRALVDGEAMPREFGGSLRRALANNSPWQSRAAQSELLRVATQEELSLVICSMPGIERAAVLYDVAERSGFDGGLRGGPLKTASVNVCTQLDTELDPLRVQAIRVLVASSIAGMSVDHVAVTDLRSGRVFIGPMEQEIDPAAADPTLTRKIGYERHFAAKLRQALSFIKGVVIDVAVDFEPAPSSVSDDAAAEMPAAPILASPASIAAANAPLEIVPRVAAVPPDKQQPAAHNHNGPRSIHVSIAVPDSYFQTAADAVFNHNENANENANGQREVDRIRHLVLQMIPATPSLDNQHVTITRFAVAPSAVMRRELTATTLPLAAAPAAAGAEPPSVTQAQDSTASRHSTAFTLNDVLSLRLWRSADVADVPRETWLAATSICVGLLAGFLWWAGSRQRPARDLVRAARPASGRTGHPQIDWTGVSNDSFVTDPHDTSPQDYKAAA